MRFVHNLKYFEATEMKCFRFMQDGPSQSECEK